MAIRSASDAFYTVLARLPLLLLAVGVLWVFATGLHGLEMYSFGTEFLVGNDETTNALPTLRSDEEILYEALNSGDTAQMQAALSQVEARHAAPAAPAAIG